MLTVPPGVTVFTTCPPSAGDGPAYLAKAEAVARWSDEAGCEGILVYTDNGIVDPWLMAEAIIRVTDRLSPLVAIQPAYMNPYTAAKMVATLGYLYGRRMYLNMVAGGFKNDLTALGDETPHDRRYDRLREYTQIMLGLLSSGDAFTFEGEFYVARTLKMTPALAPDLTPGVFVSGSSPAGLAAAAALDAVAVQYPKPPTEYEIEEGGPRSDKGIRIGIIADDNADAAWAIAHERFPVDRVGKLTHEMAMRVSDSHWHQQLSNLGGREVSAVNPYWLVPFENYKTFCPYLVGTYADVATIVRRYLEAGFGTFILDVPREEADLETANRVFALALDSIRQ